MPAFNLQALNSVNFRQRVLSALVMVPLVLLAVYGGGWIYILVVTLIVVLGLREWQRLVMMRRSPLFLIYGVLLLLLGPALAYLRAMPGIGMGLVYYLLFVVWGTDIGAYAAGRMIGGPKLAPGISPNKTWAGLLGGMALAASFGYGVAAVFEARQAGVAAGLAVLLAVVSQMGDLFESHLKRCSGVKESGGLIPGHGGVLDRIDGLVFAAIFFVLFQLALGAQMQWW